MADEVKFYIRKAEYRAEVGNFVYTDTSWIDLENNSDWEGLKYASAKGLYSKGKNKNVYTESYSDAKSLRVWQGDLIQEATEIELTFYIIGEQRGATFDNFYDFLSTGRIDFYDTKRRKVARMIMTEEYTVSEETYKGSKPYLEFTVKMQNVAGFCATPPTDAP